MLRRRTVTAPQTPSIQIPPIEREKPHHKRLFFRQLQALLAKHYHETIRQYKWMLVEILLAPLLVCLVLFISQSTISFSNQAKYGDGEWALGGVNRCDSPSGCITLLYTPKSYQSIITTFLKKNEQRVGYQLAHSTTPANGDVSPLPDGESMYSYATKHPEQAYLGVEFEGTENEVHYTIWYNATACANTTVFPRSKTRLRNTEYDDPHGVQIAALMRGIDEAILSRSGNVQYEVKMGGISTTEKRNSETVWIFGASLLFLPAMLVFVAAMADIAREKHRHRPQMQSMGLHPSVYWIAGFIAAASRVVVQSLVFVGLGAAFRLSFFSLCNPVIVFVLLTFFGFAMLWMGFFLTTVISGTSETMATAFGITAIGLVYQLLAPGFWYSFYVDVVRGRAASFPAIMGWIIGMFVPFFNFSQLYIDITLKTSGSVDPATGKYVAGDWFGMQDLFIAPRVGGKVYSGLVPMPMTNILWLIIDIAFWMFLTFVVDQKAFLAMFSRANMSYGALEKHPYLGPENEDSNVAQERHDTLNRTTPVAVRIVNLEKQYADKKVLDRVTFSVDYNTILVLRGHNGAGKSTLMSLLSGSLEATSGDAFICGRSIRTNIAGVNRTLGVCPQDNRLFSLLTAKEHVELFAAIQGYSASQAQGLAKKLLGLLHVGDGQTGQMSGGTQRRVAVAVACIGQVLLLDEPTAGMDPQMQRITWRVLQMLGRPVIVAVHGALKGHLARQNGLLVEVELDKGRLVQIRKSNNYK